MQVHKPKHPCWDRDPKLEIMLLQVFSQSIQNAIKNLMDPHFSKGYSEILVFTTSLDKSQLYWSLGKPYLTYVMKIW